MNPPLIGIIGIVILVIIILSGLPIGFSMFIVGFIGFSYLVSLDAGLRLLSMEMLSTFSSYTLAVVTCFALMGALAGYSGTSKRLYDFAYKFFGKYPGGLAIATMGACSLFGAICGSATAATATFGKVALPEMKRHNYSDQLATGCIACGGTLSILIPPSLIFIIYGVIANKSIGELFIAGIGPGILLTIFLILQILFMCLKNPSLGPPGPESNLKEKLRSLIGAIEAIGLFLIILGGIFAGIFTPTEGGAIGAVGMLVVGLVRRTLNWNGIINSVIDTARLIGMIFMILAGAFVFGRFITVTNLALTLSDLMVGLKWHPIITFIVFILPIYIIAGCFIEMLAVILITVPLFLPIVEKFGFDPIWFGVQIVMLSQIGLLTPPVGMCAYTVKAVAPEFSLTLIFKGTIVFVPTIVICSIIVLFFPQIALWLPKLMMK